MKVKKDQFKALKAQRNRCKRCKGEVAYVGYQTAQLMCQQQGCGQIINLAPRSLPKLIEQSIYFKGCRAVAYDGQTHISITTEKNNLRQQVQKRFGFGSYTTKYHYSDKLKKKYHAQDMGYRGQLFYENVVKPITQYQQYLPLRIDDSKIANGKGLFATAKVKYGQYVIAYIGQVIEQMEFWPPSDSVYQLGYYYDQQINQQCSIVIEPVTKLNAGRFINSIDQDKCNLQIQRVICNNQIYLLLKARRDIDIGEQLFYYYGMDYSNSLGKFDPSVSNSQNKKEKAGWVSRCLSGVFPIEIQRNIFYNEFKARPFDRKVQTAWKKAQIQTLRNTTNKLTSMKPKQKFQLFLQFQRKDIALTQVMMKRQLTPEEQTQAKRWFQTKQSQYENNSGFAKSALSFVRARAMTWIQEHKYYPQIQYLKQLEQQNLKKIYKPTDIKRCQLVRHKQKVKNIQEHSEMVIQELNERQKQIKMIAQLNVINKSINQSKPLKQSTLKWYHDGPSKKQYKQIEQQKCKVYTNVQTLLNKFKHPLVNKVQEIVINFYKNRQLTQDQIKMQTDLLLGAYDNQQRLIGLKVYGFKTTKISGNGKQAAFRKCRLCSKQIADTNVMISNHYSLMHKDFTAEIDKLKEFSKPTFIVESNSSQIPPKTFMCRKAATLHFRSVSQHANIISLVQYKLVQINQDGVRKVLQSMSPPPKRNFQASWGKNEIEQMKSIKKVKPNESLQKPLAVIEPQRSAFKMMISDNFLSVMNQQQKHNLYSRMSRDTNYRLMYIQKMGVKDGYIDFANKQLNHDIRKYLAVQIKQILTTIRPNDTDVLLKFKQDMVKLRLIFKPSAIKHLKQKSELTLHINDVPEINRNNEQKKLLKQHNQDIDNLFKSNRVNHSSIQADFTQKVNRSIRIKCQGLIQKNFKVIMLNNFEFITKNISVSDLSEIRMHITKTHVIDWQFETQNYFQEYVAQFCQFFRDLFKKYTQIFENGYKFQYRSNQVSYLKFKNIQNQQKPIWQIAAQLFSSMINNELNKSKSLFYRSWRSSFTKTQYALFNFIENTQMRSFLPSIRSVYKNATKHLMQIIQIVRNHLQLTEDQAQYSDFHQIITQTALLADRDLGPQINQIQKLFSSQNKRWLVFRYYNLRRTVIKNNGITNLQYEKKTKYQALLIPLILQQLSVKYGISQRYIPGLDKIIDSHQDSVKLHLKQCTLMYWERVKYYVYYAKFIELIYKDVKSKQLWLMGAGFFKVFDVHIYNLIATSTNLVYAYKEAIQKQAAGFRLPYPQPPQLVLQENLKTPDAQLYQKVKAINEITQWGMDAQ